MTPDHSTLLLAGGFVTVASGLFLMTYWWQDRTSWAALGWAASHIVSGVGVMIRAAHDTLPEITWHIAALLMIGSGYALIGVAAWIFNGGFVRRGLVVAAIGLWCALTVFAAASGYDRLEMVLGPGLSGCVCAAAAVKFWLGRDEVLGGRMPMVGLLGLQAFALILLVFGVSSTAMLESPKAMSGLFGIIRFVQLIFAVGSAVSLVMMLKDRTEAKYKAASLTDPLTGLPNRRAFMERGQRYIDRCNHEQTAISLLAFDLDRFKTINDTFGHPFGDQVMQIFGNVLSRAVRPSDKVARIGGEEFFALLPAYGSQAAVLVANRLRIDFESDARYVNERLVAATVSVGVATVMGGSFDELIASADEALYRAKTLGRNRVVLASATDDVVRVA